MKLTVVVEVGARQIRPFLLDLDEKDRLGLPVMMATDPRAADVNGLDIETALVDAVGSAAESVSGSHANGVEAVAVIFGRAVDRFGRISEVITSTGKLYAFGQHLLPRLRAAFQTEVRVDFLNRSCMGAVGELKYGLKYGFGPEFANVGDLVYVSVGSIVGAGMVAQGRLLLGHHGFAGQFGHMLVDRGSQRQCPGCHRKGCLSSLVGGDAILAALETRKGEPAAAELIDYLGKNRTPAAKDAGDRKTINGIEVDARALVEAAGIADGQRFPVAHDIMMKVAEPLGAAIGQLICLLDPAVVAVGGIVANAEYLDRALREAASHYLPRDRQELMRVHRTGFTDIAQIDTQLSGDETAVYGAAYFMHEGSLLAPPSGATGS